MPEPSGIFARTIFSGRYLPLSISLAFSCCASAMTTIATTIGRDGGNDWTLGCAPLCVRPCPTQSPFGRFLVLLLSDPVRPRPTPFLSLRNSYVRMRKFMRSVQREIESP